MWQKMSRRRFLFASRRWPYFELREFEFYLFTYLLSPLTWRGLQSDRDRWWHKPVSQSVLISGRYEQYIPAIGLYNGRSWSSFWPVSRPWWRDNGDLSAGCHAITSRRRPRAPYMWWLYVRLMVRTNGQNWPLTSRLSRTHKKYCVWWGQRGN